MDGYNNSTPEGRSDRIRSVICLLRVTTVSGWDWGTYLIHGVTALQRRIVVFLHRYWLLLFSGLTLLLAIRIQYVFPQWSVSSVQFLQENLLVVGTVVLLLLFFFLWKVPKWQVANIPDEKDRLATESGFRQTLVQLVGGAALLGGLYFTAQTLRTSQEALQVNQETLRTTQQSQITERFSKAIEHLGDTQRLMIRLGGIYALEQIANDGRVHDYIAVMEVLTAFVREQTQGHKATSNPPPRKISKSKSKGKSGLDAELQAIPDEEKPRLAADIQAVLTVLGRNPRTFDSGEVFRFDLHGAQLQGADLLVAQLQGANLSEAQLQGADLEGADLTKAKNLTQDQINRACTGFFTKLPKGLIRPAPCPTSIRIPTPPV